MRLTVTAGGRTVDLRTDPTEGVSLRAAEKAVLRLFRSIPADDDGEDQAFGFALSSDTERAPEAETTESDDDE